MEKDMVFFSQEGKGLTSTSANHVANLAKEMIRNIETSLSDMKFFLTSVSLIGGENPNVLNIGNSNDDVETIIDRLYQVAKAKSLIAWLREAIKTKDRMLKETKDLSLEDYAELKGIELEDEPDVLEYAGIDEEEYYASLSIGERCRYYTTEALASTLGKAIHPGGSFADARNGLQSIMQKPHRISGDGRDTLIYTYTATVDGTKVEDVYFRLQKLYRDAQSKLNGMKQTCQNEIDKSYAEKYTEFTKAMIEWSGKRKQLTAEMNEHINSEVQRISGLRIVIPESLTDIYDIVNNLGKKE